MKQITSFFLEGESPTLNLSSHRFSFLEDLLSLLISICFGAMIIIWCYFCSNFKTLYLFLVPIQIWQYFSGRPLFQYEYGKVQCVLELALISFRITKGLPFTTRWYLFEIRFLLEEKRYCEKVIVYMH